MSALMARALAGEAAPYEEALGLIVKLVRAYLGRRGVAPTAAEDLTQEVLLTVHRKKHLYDPARPFLPWLYTLTRYRVIDDARARSRRPSGIPWEDGEDVAASEPSIDDALTIEEMLAALSEKHRRVLTLAKIDGLPLAEVARRTGLTTAAVKVIVHRAIKKLRETFAP